MMTSSGSRAAIVLIAGAGLTVLASGTAFAYWTTVGAGTGAATATTAAPLTTSGVVTAAGLYPGGSAGGSLRISNPNPFSVSVTAATFAPVAAPSSACVTTGVSFTPTTSPTAQAPLVIAPGGTVSLPYTVSMSSDSDDGCQGATFTSTLSLSGTS